MVTKSVSDTIKSILTQTKSPKFFIESKNSLAEIQNFYPICMIPPICFFTSETAYNLESTYNILIETSEKSSESYNKSFQGRLFHLSILPNGYLYFLEVKSIK